MRVQVNEPRGDDEITRIDRISPAYSFRRDDGDSSLDESDVADRIEVGLWIHDVPAEDHAVVDSVRCVLRRHASEIADRQDSVTRSGGASASIDRSSRRDRRRLWNYPSDWRRAATARSDPG